MPNPTANELKAINAIVTLFEQGKPTSKNTYGTITLIPNDSGGLTYGKHQTTRNSGSLGLLIEAYLEAPNTDVRAKALLQPYLTRLLQRDPALDRDPGLREGLKLAGNDPFMIELQEQFFAQVYMAPALAAASGLGIETALGRAVVYDSYVHGSWGAVRDITRTKVGTPKVAGERRWVSAYVEARYSWLDNNKNAALHPTVYRMECFRHLIAQGAWDLTPPFKLRGPGGKIWDITATLLGIGNTQEEPNIMPTKPNDAASAEEPDEKRLLLLTNPLQTGADVDRLQRVLNTRGYSVVCNGFFDEQTKEAVIMFQRYEGRGKLKVDGKVGPATRVALGID